MKKTNEKVLMSVIAGMTALQGVSSTMMNISATTSHVANVKQTMTKSDEFESKLHDAKNIVSEKKIDFNSAKGASSVASKQLEILQAAYDARNVVVKQNYQTTYDAIMNELQPILNEIESLETQTNNSKKNLEEQSALNEKASVDLEQAQKNLDAKKTELAELQNKLATLKDVADLTTALETAKSEKETANSVLTSAQEKADAADTELTNAIADAEAKKAAVEEASVAYNNAVADVTAKTNIVVEKQAIVDQFEDENGIENAKAELETAQTDLVVAQKNVTSLQEAMTQAQTAYDTAVNVQQTAQTNYELAVGELETAKTNLANAQESLIKAQTDYDANQKEIEAKNNEILALNTQIANAQSEVDKAQADYDKALNDYNSTSSPLEQAKKNLADFESKYATELSRLTAGSKGYFESLGCYDILKEIFNVNNDSSSRGELASYTHMGQAGDATSLENMQASIAYLKEYDKLRKQNGLSTPKVSMVAMAIAQVNANYAQAEGNHSGVYGYSENLAWGYGEAGTGASPFRGWYDYEKKQYEAGNHKFSEVGHYLNIVNPDDETTGFALQKVNGVYAQEFGYFEEKDIVMSIDEFETSFNDYYNNLKSVDTQHKALKDAVNNANGTTTKDDTALKNAEALLKSKKDALTGLQNKLTQVNNAKAALEANATVMNNTVTEAKNAVQNAENTVSQKKVNVTNAEQALSETKSGVEAKENVKAEAEKKLADAKANVNNIHVRIDTLNDDIANWDTNKAKARKELQAAQENLKTANNVKTEAKKAFEKANEDVAKAEAVRDEAQIKADQACEELEKATVDFKTKSETVVQAQKAVDDYNTNAEAVKKAQAEMKIIGNQIVELKVCKESTNEKIDSLKAQIEVLNKSLTEKKSDALPFEQFKTVLNDVMNQGSKADLTSVENEKIRAFLSQLGATVDERDVVQKSLEKAKNNYVEKYNLYLDAKEALLKAESDYNEVLSQLNAFLFEQNKENSPTKKDEVKTSSVNTGVSTNVEASVTTAGLALAGIVLTETKRRKK
ncbi:CAP domain-containing protein [uncultured Holdemanella sp.]|uniref:CAP domain-containing protein n=1 Tax=uncultured Holdemanella sp. TaxID=1763549 RepID=UPI0025884EDD|nr:CAP domain-containing protein [uncultured Holdemanella sp.]